MVNCMQILVFSTLCYRTFDRTSIVHRDLVESDYCVTVTYAYPTGVQAYVSLPLLGEAYGLSSPLSRLPRYGSAYCIVHSIQLFMCQPEMGGTTKWGARRWGARMRDDAHPGRPTYSKSPD